MCEVTIITNSHPSYLGFRDEAVDSLCHISSVGTVVIEVVWVVGVFNKHCTHTHTIKN